MHSNPNLLRPLLLRVHEAARLLKVHPNTVKAWAAQGRLPAVRPNGAGKRRPLLFRVETLEAFVRQHEGKPAPSGNGSKSSRGRPGKRSR